MSTQKEWDLYFLRIARTVSKKSNCSSRKLGAVLVQDKTIVSTGMNGSPMGITHCCDRFNNFDELFAFVRAVTSVEDKEVYRRKLAQIMIDDGAEFEKGCPRKILGFESGKGLFLCNAGHAERNALLLAARNGIRTKGCTLYAFCGLPCKDCMIEIINAGIKRVVFLRRDRDYDQYSRILLEESDIDYIAYNESGI